MVMVIEVEKRGQVCNIVKSNMELDHGLDRIAERKDARKTPKCVAQHAVDCCNISQDRQDVNRRDRSGGGRWGVASILSSK